MKTNKLAAGALALALGLGAVTPAFAESTKTGNEKKGEVIITQEYRDAETKFVKAFKAVQDAKAKEAEAKKVRDAKEAAHEEAKAAVDKHDEEEEDIQRRLASIDEEGNRIFEQLKGNGGSSSATGWMDVTRDNFTLGAGNEASQNAQQASLEDLLAKQAKYKEVEKELEGREETRRKLQIAVDRAAEELDVAESNYQNAVIATAAAEGEYGVAKAAFLDAGAKRADIGKAEKYGDLKYITVDPAEKDSESKEDVLAKAEKAYEDARVTVKAVELIKVTAPKVYENNKVAIDAYLEKANAAINKLGKALGKKVAVSDLLFSTAYADEEASLEEIKDLTKEVEDVDKEGKELLENINKQEEEADKEEDNKDKPADKDDNKDKPADKDDDKEADKKDEKEADKKDEKKPAAKKASSNAKTGVAGVTGVAGILAAASVAYAASKKRD